MSHGYIPPTKQGFYDENIALSSGSLPVHSQYTKEYGHQSLYPSSMNGSHLSATFEGHSISVAALRRITELEIELKQEKGRTADLIRHIAPFNHSDSHNSDIDSSRPIWLGSNREASLVKKLREAECEIQEATSRIKDLENRLDTHKLSLKTALADLRDKLKQRDDLLREKQDEIMVLQERINCLEVDLLSGKKYTDVEAETAQFKIETAKKMTEDLIMKEKELIIKDHYLDSETTKIEILKRDLVTQREALSNERALIVEERRELNSKGEQLLVKEADLQQSRIKLSTIKKKKEFFSQHMTVNIQLKGTSIKEDHSDTIYTLKKRLETSLAVQELLKSQLTAAQKMAGLNASSSSSSVSPDSVPQSLTTRSVRRPPSDGDSHINRAVGRRLPKSSHPLRRGIDAVEQQQLSPPSKRQRGRSDSLSVPSIASKDTLSGSPSKRRRRKLDNHSDKYSEEDDDDSQVKDTIPDLHSDATIDNALYTDRLNRNKPLQLEKKKKIS